MCQWIFTLTLSHFIRFRLATDVSRDVQNVMSLIVAMNAIINTTHCLGPGVIMIDCQYYYYDYIGDARCCNDSEIEQDINH